MTENDFEAFSGLMLQMAEICAGDENPSKEKIEFYFEVLKDLPFERIKQNALIYFGSERVPFFPSPAILRGEADRDIEAQLAWDRINYYLDRFYAPEIGQCMMEVIRKRMEKNGDGHLYQHLVKWGPEILNTTAIAATRKHFLEAYKVEKNLETRKQITTGSDAKALSEILPRAIVGKREAAE